MSPFITLETIQSVLFDLNSLRSEWTVWNFMPRTNGPNRTRKRRTFVLHLDLYGEHMALGSRAHCQYVTRASDLFRRLRWGFWVIFNWIFHGRGKLLRVAAELSKHKRFNISNILMDLRGLFTGSVHGLDYIWKASKLPFRMQDLSTVLVDLPVICSFTFLGLFSFALIAAPFALA